MSWVFPYFLRTSRQSPPISLIFDLVSLLVIIFKKIYLIILTVIQPMETLSLIFPPGLNPSIIFVQFIMTEISFPFSRIWQIMLKKSLLNNAQ